MEDRGRTTLSSSESIGLGWNNYSSSVLDAIKSLFKDDKLADVTLTCEGQYFKAHRFLLSACSPFFQRLLDASACRQSIGNAVIVVFGVKARYVEHLLEFIYTGRTEISSQDLKDFLNAGKLMEISGLDCDVPGEVLEMGEPDVSVDPLSVSEYATPPSDLEQDVIPAKRSKIGPHCKSSTSIPQSIQSPSFNVGTAHFKDENHVITLPPKSHYISEAGFQFEGSQVSQVEGRDHVDVHGEAVGMLSGYPEDNEEGTTQYSQSEGKPFPRSLNEFKLYRREGFSLDHRLRPYYEYLVHLKGDNKKHTDDRMYPFQVKCKICLREIVAHRSHNLWNHLKTHGVDKEAQF